MPVTWVVGHTVIGFSSDDSVKQSGHPNIYMAKNKNNEHNNQRSIFG